MNTFKGSLGILIAAFSVAAPFAATWASAYGMIPLNTERWIYFLSYLAVIVGWVAFLIASFSRPARRKLKIIFSLLIPFAGWSAVNFANKHAFVFGIELGGGNGKDVVGCGTDWTRWTTQPPNQRTHLGALPLEMIVGWQSDAPRLGQLASS